MFLGLDGRCIHPAVAPMQPCEQLYNRKRHG